MLTINLVYVHIPCPNCGLKFIPLSAWIVPCDYDEDGRANGIEIDKISCVKCGELHEESEDICNKIIDAFYNLDNAKEWPLMVEVGTIYSYYQKEDVK